MMLGAEFVRSAAGVNTVLECYGIHCIVRLNPAG
jgi:hypothetical protein